MWLERVEGFAVSPVLRALLLYVSGVLAIVANAAGVIFVQYWGYWEAVPVSLWKHLDSLPVIDAAAAAAVLSMLVPPAYFGANLLRHSAEPLTIARGWDGERGQFVIFFLTGFVVLPLVFIFPFDQIPRDEMGPSLFSAQNYLWSYVFVWWAHGAVNAYHVRRLHARNSGRDHGVQAGQS